MSTHSAAETTARRFRTTVVVILLACLVAIVTLTVVVTSAISRAERQAAYERCLAAAGYTLDDAPNIDLGQMIRDTEHCAT